ncbi:MAG: hypothetical protein HZA66_08610 [Rhodopseudomonas palustris]|uniref:Uncharacterized protein n=1 Tax=Rhodopseudomonas palustris TaxID=1076 RepID=A0A933RVM6_RHOPL|nr:hypothetical protein [Rhodopseudomonas palustris]
MKGIVLVGATILALTSAAHAQYGYGSNSRSHSVSPYVNSHGTYVPGSHATNPNSTQSDNYTTRGNVNPYTGEIGTRTPRY